MGLFLRNVTGGLREYVDWYLSPSVSSFVLGRDPWDRLVKRIVCLRYFSSWVAVSYSLWNVLFVSLYAILSFVSSVLVKTNISRS